ncbi:hypothetical protein Y032_0029g1860 [Ancylostoma ceylanicum]|uniref:Uncharacterized protein n=2 Tax=Ancylostoma ceylanicum TaxID=53326 RepID=A0A016URD1_9BILA|nr:hypothetical protein Y032_0029g1860 [Ancylostoma ceylanicum]
MLQGSKDLPPILPRKVRNVLSQMKVGKAPEPDNTTVQMQIASLADSVIWLLFKKETVGNFRPIALLSTVHKFFSSILGHQMLNCLDVNKPVEQSGLRRKHSMVDHIHVIDQLIEKSHEYKFPLYEELPRPLILWNMMKVGNH